MASVQPDDGEFYPVGSVAWSIQPEKREYDKYQGHQTELRGVVKYI